MGIVEAQSAEQPGIRGAEVFWPQHHVIEYSGKEKTDGKQNNNRKI